MGKFDKAGKVVARQGRFDGLKPTATKRDRKSVLQRWGEDVALHELFA